MTKKVKMISDVKCNGKMYKKDSIVSDSKLIKIFIDGNLALPIKEKEEKSKK